VVYISCSFIEFVSILAFHEYFPKCWNKFLIMTSHFVKCNVACSSGYVEAAIFNYSPCNSGGRGGYGGGGRRRDNYRDGGNSGPDRHQHGGNRSRPY